MLHNSEQILDKNSEQILCEARIIKKFNQVYIYIYMRRLSRIMTRATRRKGLMTFYFSSRVYTFTSRTGGEREKA